MTESDRLRIIAKAIDHESSKAAARVRSNCERYGHDLARATEHTKGSVATQRVTADVLDCLARALMKAADEIENAPH
jgi:hypothetical protein